MSWTLLLVALFQAGALQPRYERFDSGLRIVIVENHTLPLASVQIWFRVGSGDDPARKTGLCAVTRAILEHRDDDALRLRAAGAQFESRTLRDACCFSSTLPPNFLEYALSIEAARLRPLSISQKDVQRGLVAAAADDQEVANTSSYRAARRTLALMFPNHPYRHPPGFVAESLAELTPGEVQEFAQRWFLPGNATVLVFGDVSAIHALELIRREFGTLEWAEVPRRAEPAPSPDEILRDRLFEPARPGLTIAWRTPPLGAFENAAIDVLMHRLCNPVDGPLYRRLTEMGCQPPQWQHSAWRHAGLLVLSLDLHENGETVNSPAIAGLERLVNEEIERATSTIPTEIEHNRARALALQNALRKRRTFREYAAESTACEAIAGDMLLADLVAAQPEYVAVPDVQQAALLLQTVRRVVLTRRSGERESGSTTAGTPSPTELPAPPTTSRGEQLDSSATLRLLAAHGQDAPAARSPEPPGTVTVQQLENGVNVRSCAIPGIQGAEVRTLVKPGIPAGTLLANGSNRLSAAQLIDYDTYHGLDLFAWRGEHRSGLRARAPSRLVSQMIELQAELLHDAEGLTAVDVLVVGDVHDAEVLAATRAFWDDWHPGRDHMSPASGPPAAAPAADTSPARTPTSTEWRTDANAAPYVLIIDELAPLPANQPASALVLQAIGRLLGTSPTEPAQLDGQRVSLWTCAPVCGPALEMHAAPAHRVLDAIERQLARIDAVRFANLPDDELNTALRLARADRLIALGDPSSIADFMRFGVQDPWDLSDGLTLNELRRLIPQVYHVLRRRIVAVGPNDLSMELRRLEFAPGSAGDSPPP